MITRRNFIQYSLAGGASLMLPFPSILADSLKTELLHPQRLTKFVDRLPRPAVLKAGGLLDGMPFYRVTMSQFSQRLHRDLPETVVWGYNGTYPGPTIESRKDEPITVEWLNNLPGKHLFPIDHTVFGAYRTEPDVRAVVHLHGGHVPPESDGNPEAWYTSNGKTGNFFNGNRFYYPNDQRAASLWYHDHALGITRLNVYAGLAGLYIIRDDEEDSLNLPSGNYEVPLVIQDRLFHKNGSLKYPVSEIPGSPWIPEFFGNTILVNGKIWPYLAVEPRKYRFRIYNGSNARFYNLEFTSGQEFYQIGNEAGFLKRPVTLQKILLAPAERADVLVDFSEHKGESIAMKSTAAAPFPGGDVETFDIMQFRVVKQLKNPDTSVKPTVLPAIHFLKKESAHRVRTLELQEKEDPEVPGRLLLLMNNHDYDSPTTERPSIGSTEIWRLLNSTQDTHPIHLHLVQFQVIDRRSIDVQKLQLNNQIEFSGPSFPPDSNELGWKDTVRVNPGGMTRIIAKFDGYKGRYAWHCHILEHEDNEMMRTLEVVD